jgi:cytidine deaminase
VLSVGYGFQREIEENIELMPDDTDYDSLVKAAAGARAHSYSPYSKFRVGAALRTNDGKVYTGCNIENAAYSPTICAERVALGAAIAAGEEIGSFEAIAVVADEAKPTSPCGVCRQVLLELAPGVMVIMAAAPEKSDERLEMKIEELLPHGFIFPEGQC